LFNTAAVTKTVVNIRLKRRGGIKVGEKTEKKRRRFMREKYTEKINSTANLALRREIFRLARNRDILGIVLIIAALAIIALSIFLYRH
jgi:type IV secretory pathway component VirB8